MKAINVYLQRPWKFADSPYYKYLLENPVPGVHYLGQNTKQGALEKKWEYHALSKLKSTIRSVFRTFPLPIPNAHLTYSKEKRDLIHCAHCLSLNNEPWVADTEWVGQFWLAANFDKHPSKRWVRKILHNPNCKNILAWTQWTKEGIL